MKRKIIFQTSMFGFNPKNHGISKLVVWRYPCYTHPNPSNSQGYPWFLGNVNFPGCIHLGSPAFDVRIHPSSEALGVEQIGHRLLLARGILALEQQWGEPGCHGNRKKNHGTPWGITWKHRGLRLKRIWYQIEDVHPPKTDMTIENPHVQ